MGRREERESGNVKRTSLEYRIQTIGDMMMAKPAGTVAGVCVDDEPGKPELYKQRLLTAYPQLEVIWEGKTLPGVYTIKIRKREPAV